MRDRIPRHKFSEEEKKMSFEHDIHKASAEAAGESEKGEVPERHEFGREVELEEGDGKLELDEDRKLGTAVAFQPVRENEFTEDDLKPKGKQPPLDRRHRIG